MFARRFIPVLVSAVLAVLWIGSARAQAAEFSFSRIYIEYNQTANDLGYHVTLDGEDWTRLAIFNTSGTKIFEVQGRAAYKLLGMTELFFEGAEPSLDDFPLRELLALFPEGDYSFAGTTADGEEIEGTGTLSHAVPNGPGNVSAVLSGDSLVISWDKVTTTPPGFPKRPITIVGYQLIVEAFQVTVPDSVTSVTVSPEFVNSLPSGEVLFEVLAIDETGNQSITESKFVKP
jgi:hypothetical protein